MISRKYLQESVVWMLAFLLTFALAAWLAKAWPGPSPWRLLVLAPAVAAVCAGLWVELRQVARMDELHRYMYLIATLTGSMLAMLFCAVAYMGEALEFWPRISPIYAVAALGLGFAVGWIGARRRFG
ncbi:MAG: hypothetical protein ACRETF_04760 [Nevskiaceae bacterium]